MPYDPSSPLTDASRGSPDGLPRAADWSPAEPASAVNPGFWRKLVEGAIEAVAVLDADGTIVYESPPVAELTGYSPRERVGRDAFDHVHEADRERARQLFKRVLALPGTAVSAEFRLCHADGSDRYVRATARNLLEDPTVAGVVANFMDITEARLREQELQRSETRFRDLVEAAPDSIVTLDLEGRVLFANSRWVAQFGFGQAELPRLLFRDLVTEEHCDLLEQHLQSSSRDNGIAPVSVYDGVSARRANGTTFPTEVRLSRIATASGLHFVCIFRDITRRKRTEVEIRRLSTYPQTNPSPMIESDASGRVIFANPAAVELAGQLQVSATGLLAPTHAIIIEQCLATPARTQRVENVVAGRIIEWTYRPVDGGEIVRLYGTDVTDKRKAEQRIEYDTLHDAVTGLANRTLFKSYVDRALAQCRARGGCDFAVVLLDLDRFKVVNESLGHVAGNVMLVEVSKRLERLLPPGALLARFGGDEFATLVDVPRGTCAATDFAEAVQQALSQPFSVSGEEVYTSASIGIAYGSAAYPEADYVIGDAERAMYRAKSRGKARHAVADANSEPDSKRLLSLETRLRKALDRREFFVLYQPIVSLESGAIAGFESLVRWRTPEGDVVEPARFIPTAEDTGLIVGIGEFVLEQTCNQVKQWIDQGLHPGLASVNISTRQFQQEYLVDLVRATIDRHGVSPSCLKLEITETTAATDLPTVRSTLQALKALGVGIVIDDFGTGYSSLSHLQHFPIDLLKIDRSFVSTITDHADAAAIVRAIVAMAHSLGLEVVAEGVETNDQLEFLFRQRVDYIQGFLFSRPVTASEFGAMLLDSRRLEYKPASSPRRKRP